MKILIDARLYGLEHAGIGRYVMNLVSELVGLDKTNEYTIFLSEKYYKRLHLPGNWKKVLANLRHYTFAEQLQLPGMIAKEKPDLVHFPHLNVPIFYTGSYVVTIHDMTMHQQGFDATTLPLPMYLAKRVPYKIAFYSAVKRAQTIIVPSNSVKKEVLKYFKIDNSKIKVTYEGFDAVYKDIKIKPNLDSTYYNLGSRYFVYTGNAYPHKNLKRLVRAVVHLNEHLGMGVSLAIVGSKTIFLNRIKKYIDELEAENYVKVLGYVPDEYLRLIYKNSVAFVFPSLSEGFGLPGLEAMASGTLVLASEIPIFKEIYKGNVSYFDPVDFRSIAHCMKEAIKISSGKRTKIIRRAQRFVKNYSWTKMARQTLEVYENCNSI